MSFDLSDPKTFHSVVNGCVISNNLASIGRLYEVHGSNEMATVMTIDAAVAHAEKSSAGPYAVPSDPEPVEEVVPEPVEESLKPAKPKKPAKGKK